MNNKFHWLIVHSIYVYIFYLYFGKKKKEKKTVRFFFAASLTGKIMPVCPNEHKPASFKYFSLVSPMPA